MKSSEVNPDDVINKIARISKEIEAKAILSIEIVPDSDLGSTIGGNCKVIMKDNVKYVNIYIEEKSYRGEVIYHELLHAKYELEKYGHVECIFKMPCINQIARDINDLVIHKILFEEMKKSEVTMNDNWSLDLVRMIEDSCTNIDKITELHIIFRCVYMLIYNYEAVIDSLEVNKNRNVCVYQEICKIYKQISTCSLDTPEEFIEESIELEKYVSSYINVPFEDLQKKIRISYLPQKKEIDKRVKEVFKVNKSMYESNITGLIYKENGQLMIAYQNTEHNVEEWTVKELLENLDYIYL